MYTWAWVTRTQPLQVQLFTDMEPLDADLTTLDPNLEQGDHVMVQWRGTSIIVLGKRYEAGQSPTALTDDPADRRAEILAETEGVLDAAQARVDEVIQALGALTGTTPPTEPDTEGRVYYQRDAEGEVVAVFRFTDGAWVTVPPEDAVYVRVTTDQLVAGMALIDGVLIEEGTVTGRQINAGEVWANEAFITALEASNARFRGGSGGLDLTVSGNGVSITRGAVAYADQSLSNATLNGHRRWTAGEWTNWQLTDAQGGNIRPDLGDYRVQVVVNVTDVATAKVDMALLEDPSAPDAWSLRQTLSAGTNTLTVDQHWLWPSENRTLTTFGWVALSGGVSIVSMNLTLKVDPDRQPVLDLDSNGLRIWDEDGAEVINLSPTGTNQITGRISTNRPGKPGLILVPDTNTGRPAIFFSETGRATGDQPAIYMDATWDMHLRSKNRIQFDQSVTGLGGRFSQDLAVGGGLYSEGHITTGSAANTFMNATSGLISRSTSARKYKADIQAVEISDDLLDLEVKDWIDKGEAAEREDLSTRVGPLTEQDAQRLAELSAPGRGRNIGMIADEVEEIDPRFVTYTDDGEVDGLAYDRLGVALIPIIRRQRDRISDLQDENEALRSRLTAIEAHLGL